MRKTNPAKKTPSVSSKGFFETHPGLVGVFILLGLVLFPRLTTFFMYRGSVSPWGLLLWIFLPRFLIAIVASQRYSKTDPVLVGLAWVVAILAPITGNHYLPLPWNSEPPVYIP